MSYLLLTCACPTIRGRPWELYVFQYCAVKDRKEMVCSDTHGKKGQEIIETKYLFIGILLKNISFLWPINHSGQLIL